MTAHYPGIPETLLLIAHQSLRFVTFTRFAAARSIIVAITTSNSGCGMNP